MFALSQLVDIPQIFRRLDALPRELATARQELWAAVIQRDEALRDYERVKGETDPKEARGRFLTCRDEETIRKDNLFNLRDELSALRAKVDLITALGRQETSESVLLRRLLDTVRSVPGQDETVLEAEPPPRQRGEKAVPSRDPDLPEETVLESVHSLPF